MRGWLKKYRTEANMTMKEISEKLCISESYYCAIENGDRQKKMDMFLAAQLSVIFKISIVEIFELEKQPEEDKNI